MTAIEAVLRRVAPCRWQDVPGTGIEEWLWMDTAGDCLHLQATLGARPADVSHVWGWGPRRAIRLRVDRYLPDGAGSAHDGVVGAVLDVGEAEESFAEVPPEQIQRVEELRGQVWHPRDGRINADPTHPLFMRSRRVTTWTVARRTSWGAGGFSLLPLTFLRLEP